MRMLVAVGVLALAVSFAASAVAAPKARFTVSPRSPVAGAVVKLDASASKCRSCTYRWHLIRHATARRLASGKVVRRRFSTAGRQRIRLTVVDRKGRRARRTKQIRIRAATNPPGGENAAPAPPGPLTRNPPAPPPPPPPPPPESPLPPLGQPSCTTGATDVTTAAEVRSEVADGHDVCVTAPVGNINLDDLTSATVRHIGTSPAGSIGEIHLQDGSRITFRARFRSINLTDADNITIEQSRIGGTSTARTLDHLILIPEGSDDVTIRDNDIGWTTADDSGDTGYGIRAFNDLNRLRIERNYIHHLGGDAIHLGIDGIDTLVDRNEVAFVARPETSNEHSDDLQIEGNGPNTLVTNNYFHHCGWLTATGPETGCNSMAIHAGDSDTLRYENNVEAHALGLPYIGDLGTGGTERSNTTFRNNTWWDNGTQFPDEPDLQWGLDGGSNNRWERNLVVSKMNFSDHDDVHAGFPQSGTTASDNLVGNYAMNAGGECTAAACKPVGQRPIGYRKPAGVHW